MPLEPESPLFTEEWVKAVWDDDDVDALFTSGRVKGLTTDLVTLRKQAQTPESVPSLIRDAKLDELTEAVHVVLEMAERKKRKNR